MSSFFFHFSCYLSNETNFIWAFIAPVVLIIFVNIIFFIMAAVVLWQQRKKRNDKMGRKDIATWLKALVFLLVIMGITWILGALI